MSEILFYIGLFLLAAIMFAGIPFNIIKSKGANKIAVSIVNGVLLGILICVLILSSFNRNAISKKAGDGKLAQYGFFGSMKYTGSADGYFTFRINYPLGSWEVATPTGDLELPRAVKEGSRVIIAYDNIYAGSKWFGDNKTMINSTEYFLAENVKGIFRDYSGEETIVLVIDITLLFLYNLCELIMALEFKKKSKKTE